MRALELLTGFGTAIGATLAAVTMAAGNSLTVRNGAPGSLIELIQIWADTQVAGTVRLRSPQLHDNVQGLRFRHIISEVDPLLPAGFRQKLMPQDTLVLELAGSAVAGDIETVCLLVHYEDLPGINGRFLSPEDVAGRSVHLVTVENTLTLGAGGGYTGEEAINAEFDLLKANTDYAILGYHVSFECAAIRYRGIDFGNLGVGGPGNDTSKQLTGEWFVRLSRIVGAPLIPVFNSANASGVLIDGVQDENATNVVVTTILAELSGS